MLTVGFQKPQKQVIQGRSVSLVPLVAADHAEDLLVAATVPNRQEKYRYLADLPPDTIEEALSWAEKAEKSEDPMFFAVIDQDTGKAVGRQALMRIDTTNGAAEIGNIYWGPAMARSIKATEALFLTMEYIFDRLGYRRFEWKCDNNNEPSKIAANRFGFAYEGLFRQHFIIKGRNRDTAWFSVIDKEWPLLKTAYQIWLDDDNFDAEGKQKVALSALTAKALGRGNLPSLV
ncbi:MULTISPECIES: GNAT family N-acetyltransferase [Rhizobium/Agrobacterium group]|uniref:N-acetyltransferase n=1 Tax=Rhizobium rhizogenes TaxID=359 RepID=A0A546X3B5_RHIRH|nr:MULTISPECIES: GNAT family protein [Rhizobium/Agrobacterium group]TRA95255.1 N-acetyltransferase [Rhizobium rhizogenes]